MLTIVYRILPACVGIIWILMTPILATSQVNTEKIRISPEKEGFGFELTSSFAFRYGNSNYIDLSGGARLQFKHKRYLTFLISKGQVKIAFDSDDRDFSDGTRSIYKIFTHNRHVFQIKKWLWSETYVQHEFNEFLRLRIRLLAGQGVRFGIIQKEKVALYFGTSYMFEYENLNIEETLENKSKTYLNRWSNYLSLKYIPADEFALGLVLYFQPVFNAFSDFRLLAETNMEIKVADYFFMGPNLWFRYDNEPPSNVHSTDIEVNYSIKLSI